MQPTASIANEELRESPLVQAVTVYACEVGTASNASDGRCSGRWRKG